MSKVFIVACESSIRFGNCLHGVGDTKKAATMDANGQNRLRPNQWIEEYASEADAIAAWPDRDAEIACR